jgi:hypothetical protein
VPPAPVEAVALDSRATSPTPVARQHDPDARLSAPLTRSSQLLDSLRVQLRSQAVDIDHLAAENTDQRAVIKSLRADLDSHRITHKSDAQDLVRLAGKLLALSQATGLEIDDATKAIFRRRGWTSSNRHREAQKQ